MSPPHNDCVQEKINVSCATHINYVLGTLSLIWSCDEFKSNIQSLFAGFLTPPTPEGTRLLISNSILHHVDQLVADFVRLLLLAAEQIVQSVFIFFIMFLLINFDQQKVICL